MPGEEEERTKNVYFSDNLRTNAYYYKYILTFVRFFPSFKI